MDELENVNPLSGKVTNLIDSAQRYVQKTINSGMIILYWQIGKTIQEEFVLYEKAEYGERVIKNLGFELFNLYGRGYGYRNLLRMLSFYKSMPDQEMVTTLSSQLSWYHIVEIIKKKIL